MATAFLMVPKRATMLVCDACRMLVEADVAERTGQTDTLHVMPCEVRGVVVACEGCGFPLTDPPEGGYMH